MLFELHTIFQNFGADVTEDLKIYRHANHTNSFFDRKVLIEEIIQEGDLEIYQSVQRNEQLGRGLVAFFAGERGRISRLLGVWRVRNIESFEFDSADAELARAKEYLRPGDRWHVLERDSRFDEISNRVIINWPETGRHHQWLFHKEEIQRCIPVHEIRAVGLGRPFPGFSDVNLRYWQLRQLVDADAAGWSEALSSTRGVYLITELESGDLYVGSATGSDGIWGRWAEYVKSGHGGNKVMIDRTTKVEAYASNLQFTVLETMGNLSTRQDGVRAELRWKNKLGKKATILNAN